MEALITHSPILAIAVPLLAAFLTPLMGRIGPRVRDVFVIAALAIVQILVIIVARDVYANGIQVYTLGAAAPSLAIPETTREYATSGDPAA